MTGDGFFVSTDGGLSYTSGFDAQGNAVVNVLSAIGITFDWAKGGTLTLGGSDNVNGSMIVLDSKGDTVGKFNKDGLWTKNGYFEGIVKSKDAEITGGYIDIETDNEKYSAVKLSYNTYIASYSPSGIELSNSGNNFSLLASQLRFGNDTFYCLIKKDSVIVNSSDMFVSISPKSVTLNYATLNILNNSNIDCSGTAKFDGNTEFSILSKTTFNGAIIINGNFTADSAGSFSIARQADFSGNVNVSGTFQTKGTTKLCDAAYDTLGFFGGSGASKQTVSTITLTSSATTSSNASKINEIINALKSYNLI